MGTLSDVAIRNWIKAGERFEGDGDGLWLVYRKDYAVPMWRFRYRFAGKARVMNLGSYRDLSLADARKTAKDLRARVAMGHDIAGEKKERKRTAVAKIAADKLAMTVGELADEILRPQHPGPLEAPQHRARPDREGHQAQHRQTGQARHSIGCLCRDPRAQPSQR